MNEATAYQWAIAALKPIQDQVEQHKWEQAVDKVASAILQADRDARSVPQPTLAGIAAR